MPPIVVSPAILDAVHRYWFGELAGPEGFSANTNEMWFTGSAEIDRTIRERFGAALIDAAAERWDLAALTRTQQVGLIVLLDQFPRNIHRTSSEAFAYDPTARAYADALLATGIDRLYLAERAFVFLPFMHSEAIEDQDRCVMLFAAEALKAPQDWKEPFRAGLDFATKHRDLIRKFGRFPHRNAMLGRETTAEEAEFLAKHGRGY